MDATSVTSCSVDGTMVPLTASTLPDSRSACSKFPVTSAIAMMKRFPNEWPLRDPSVKRWSKSCFIKGSASASAMRHWRSEEHTSELQSQSNLVCRLLLEKKKLLH